MHASTRLMMPVLVQILVIEGLHPFFDDRVADLCDFKIYLDISDEVTSPAGSKSRSLS